MNSLRGVTGYVNAGGRGTRLSSVFASDPKLGITKALLSIGSPPITMIEHQINRFIVAGLGHVAIGVGDHEHVARFIQEHFSSSDATALAVQEQRGNGGDLLQALRVEPFCFGEHIFIVSVDGLIDMNEKAVVEQHLRTGSEITMVLTRKKGVPNEGAFYVRDNKVLFSGEAAHNAVPEARAATEATYRGSSTGALIVNRTLLEEFDWSPEDGPLGLYKEIVAFGLERGKFHAYDNGDRFFLDVGTVESWGYVQANPSEIEPFLGR